MTETDSLPRLSCPRVERHALLPLDGRAVSPVWQHIPPIGFVPATGAPPIPSEQVAALARDPALFTEQPLLPEITALPYQPTLFRACWSETHLFLAYRCIERDLWATLTRQNEPLYNELVVEAFLAPDNDIRHYYEIEVSPRNVRFEAHIHNPDLDRRTMRTDLHWRCQGIQTASALGGSLDSPPGSDRWWSVEIALPFAAFPEAVAPQAGTTWRANFFRISRPRDTANEFTAWSPTGETPANFHVPARFGVLVFTNGDA